MINMDNNKEVKPWYKRTWVIVLFVILGLWFLISLWSNEEPAQADLSYEEIPNEYDVLYSDYLNYHNTYVEDVEELDKLVDDWYEVTENSDLYTTEGYIKKLAQITNQYISSYEYYQTHQKEYISFLERNKQALEYSLEDFSVVEKKREIQDVDINLRQNMQGMADYINSLITSLEQQQSSETDIQALKDLASLVTLFI